MKDLENILKEIINTYNENLSNELKYDKVSRLWTDYYQLSNKLGIQLEKAYQTYLFCENECYKIYQEPVVKELDLSLVEESANHLKKVIDNKVLGIDDGISCEEATLLLDWAVHNARMGFSMLGIDLKTNSLNGFCELGQALSLMPFERLGVSVTKNRASDAFEYPFNHAFGTVCLPIKDEEGRVVDEYYLIDTTYRQFFSSVRCNEGRYYTREENTGKVANPDPGYFVSDVEFAKRLMADGYVVLSFDTAFKYGESFYLATIPFNELERNRLRNFDYYQAILMSGSDYSARLDELEGLNVTFPMGHLKGRYR